MLRVRHRRCTPGIGWCPALRAPLVNDVSPVETVSGCLAAAISNIGLDGGEQSWQSPRPVRFQGGG